MTKNILCILLLSVCASASFLSSQGSSLTPGISIEQEIIYRKLINMYKKNQKINIITIKPIMEKHSKQGINDLYALFQRKHQDLQLLHQQLHNKKLAIPVSASMIALELFVFYAISGYKELLFSALACGLIPILHYNLTDHNALNTEIESVKKEMEMIGAIWVQLENIAILKRVREAEGIEELLIR